MLKPIKNLLKDNILIIAIIITIAIAFLSLVKINFRQPINISFLDKVEHAIAYFVLAFSWLIALGKSKKNVFIIIVSCLLYGIVIEVLQAEITSYRTAEYLDALANTIGVVLALLIFQYFFRKKQSI